MNGCRQNGCCQLIKTYQSTIKHLNDGFVYHKHRFSLCVADYCGVFMSCLDSHSDGTHSLQRMHWWGSDVMPNLFQWRNKLVYISNGKYTFLSGLGSIPLRLFCQKVCGKMCSFFKLLKVHSVILQRWVLRWSKDIKGVDETADVSGCPLFLLKVNRRPRLTWKL